MRNMIFLWTLTVLILGAAAMAVLSGCESNTTVDGDAMRIEPEVHHFSTNRTTVVLNVIGGDPPFTWWMSDGNLGHLHGVPNNATPTRTATYERAPNAPPGSVNTVWVRDGRSVNPDACWTASSKMVAPK